VPSALNVTAKRVFTGQPSASRRRHHSPPGNPSAGYRASLHEPARAHMVTTVSGRHLIA
jgi:hypothetical protein